MIRNANVTGHFYLYAIEDVTISLSEFKFISDEIILTIDCLVDGTVKGLLWIDGELLCFCTDTKEDSTHTIPAITKDGEPCIYFYTRSYGRSVLRFGRNCCINGCNIVSKDCDYNSVLRQLI